MGKRFAALLLLPALLLTLCSGCAIFEREYFAASPYEKPDSLMGAGETTEIRDYRGLLRALTGMIAGYETERLLVFGDYDGIIADDLSTACREVRTNTALGAYCVESVTFETEQVVAYCEAEVHITYKRTAEEVRSIYTVRSREGIEESIADALEQQKSTFALQTDSDTLDEAAVRQLLTFTCLNHPALAVELPAAKITMYTGSANQKIFEIAWKGAAVPETVSAERAELAAATAAVAEKLSIGDEDAVMQACAAAAEACTGRGAPDGTAYHALVKGEASSRGLAMACKAICDALALPCLVVEGRMNMNVHYWNLVRYNGVFYHVDLSGWDGTIWLRSDGDMLGHYWWDAAYYPECTAKSFSWKPQLPSAESGDRA